MGFDGASSEPRRRAIKRPVVSDLDGTREGGLVFCIVLIAGFVVASMFSAVAVTSFWVWVALLSMAVGVSVNVQRIIARLTGHRDHEDED